MTYKKKITILIPIMRPPNVTSVDVEAINNIICKLEEKIQVRQIWIIFQNSKFKIKNLNNIEIILMVHCTLVMQVTLFLNSRDLIHVMDSKQTQ